MRRPVVGLGARIVTVLASLGVSVVIAEVALRVAAPQSTALYIPDPRVGVLHEPGAKGRWRSSEFRIDIRINRDGFRDDDHDARKPPGVSRLLAIGDSYVEAFQVPLEATTQKVLEQRLRADGYAVEVPALGVGGLGTAQELLLFESYGKRLEPDVVLLFFNPGNDLKDNVAGLKRDPRLPHFELVDGRLVQEPFRSQPVWRARLSNWLRNHFELYSLLRDASYRVGTVEASDSGLPQQFQVYSKDPDPTWQRSWEITEALLGRFDEDVRAAGGRLLVVVVANQIEMPNAWSEAGRKWPELAEPSFSPDVPFERLRDVLERRRIPFVELAPRFRDRVNREGTWPSYRIDGHWNATGHRWAAEETRKTLADLGWFPARQSAPSSLSGYGRDR